jgi:urease gamma subunit
VLQSANMTAYMSSCAHTTAAFCVLSDTIRAIRTALVETHPSRKDLEQLLTHLQTREKEKLHLTAAFHLERIRERNENIMMLLNNNNNNNNTNNNNYDDAKTDSRISKLLSQGITSLQEKLNAIVEEINECLEEIRYALIEADEQDDE